MEYRRCGNSGLLLPAISLGLWQNFGDEGDFEKSRRMVLDAYEAGITQFDLADNYGTPAGSAEVNFGKILAKDLWAHRDQIIITTKAGHLMWDGPYGEWGSRKHVIAACNQSLRRLGLDYVDIFYSHRPDPDTPLEETMTALADLVKAGKALYIGLSKYPPDLAARAMTILRELNVPCLVHQLRYSLLNRDPETEMFPLIEKERTGCVSFSPLAQGQLSDRYLNGIPADSRAAREGFLKTDQVKENLERVVALHEIARQRGQSLSEMAIAWQLANPLVTSVIIGVSSSDQLRQNLGALENTHFTAEESQAIDRITAI